MTNPIIQTDIADLLGQINQKLDKIDDRLNKLEVGQVKLEGKIEAIDEKLSGQIKSVDEKLSGQIKSVDEKLSGQIKSVDEKLSGQIKTIDEKLSGQIKALDTKVDQIDKRIGNQEFLNRGIFGGIILIVLGGAAKLFGWIGNP
jgi:chromosome segregation ATPase